MITKKVITKLWRTYDVANLWKILWQLYDLLLQQIYDSKFAIVNFFQKWTQEQMNSFQRLQKLI